MALELQLKDEISYYGNSSKQKMKLKDELYST